VQNGYLPEPKLPNWQQYARDQESYMNEESHHRPRRGQGI